MNKETLKYYTALQPLFKKKMGEWYCGDAYVDKKFSAVIQYITPHHLQQRTSMGSNIRIPETIDGQNPERGLWGMVDWGKWQAGTMLDGGFCIQSQQNPSEFTSNTPTLALLKALAAQEGVQK